MPLFYDSLLRILLFVLIFFHLSHSDRHPFELLVFIHCNLRSFPSNTHITPPPVTFFIIDYKKKVKTPCVIWISKFFELLGISVLLISFDTVLRIITLKNFDYYFVL